MRFGLVCLIAAGFVPLAAQTPVKKPAVAIAQPPGKVPADFPKDVPLPKDAKPVNALTRPDGTRRLVLEQEGALQDAIAFYTKQLPASGWTIGSQKARGAGASILADKGARTLAIGLFDRKGVVQISVEADPESKK